jgi:hypothetical protein
VFPTAVSSRDPKLIRNRLAHVFPACAPGAEASFELNEIGGNRSILHKTSVEKMSGSEARIAENLSVKCDIHVDEYECPDCLIAYSRKYNEYGIIVHNGGTSYVLILYCPWCGAKLTESKRGQ